MAFPKAEPLCVVAGTWLYHALWFDLDASRVDGRDPDTIRLRRSLPDCRHSLRTPAMPADEKAAKLDRVVMRESNDDSHDGEENGRDEVHVGRNDDNGGEDGERVGEEDAAGADRERAKLRSSCWS
jgi:hypothetical protein